MNRKTIRDLIAGIIVIAFITAAAWALGARFTPVISVAALADSVNPCAFSVLFLTIAFLMNAGSTHRDIMRIGGAYVLGIFVVYLGIGLGILQALSFFGVPHFMSKVGASLVIALGAWSLIGSLYPGAKGGFGIPRAAHGRIARLMERASMPAAFVLGAFVGLCEFPCTGGPYLMVLGLLHDASTYLAGLAYLIWYNFIFVLPLMIILAIASDEGILAKAKAWRSAGSGAMRAWGSVAMIALGIILLLI